MNISSSRMRISTADWIGVAAFGAARVKQEIVEIPERKVRVPFRLPQVTAAAPIDFDENVTVEQKREEIDPPKTDLVPQPFDLTRL